MVWLRLGDRLLKEMVPRSGPHAVTVPYPSPNAAASHKAGKVTSIIEHGASTCSTDLYHENQSAIGGTSTGDS